MQKWSFVALLWLNIASAQADPPNSAVVLNNAVLSSSEASGSCGEAAVTIQGLEPDLTQPKGVQIGSQGTITVVSKQGSLVIGAREGSAPIYLQDVNKLQCLTTPNGPRLVLALYCFARDCPPIDYRVIDPRTARIVSRQDKSDECSATCAQEALVLPLPASLQK